MSPARFRQCLLLLHWSHAVAAQAMHIDKRLIHRLATGQQDVPAWIAGPLEQLAQAHARFPFPEALPRSDKAPASA
ncbi:hypothetical protein MHL39_10635 [Roseomonas mucosa]|uniref:hypothetical protein n=1 Tax=Roseomonas mucosa TaxID=207340 RepID=UPI001EF65D73|nr:hypothetical protein [Roseomonas mucosa]MCG7357094.1 hypothetical protein [Roseomonas mucosa]